MKFSCFCQWAPLARIGLDNSVQLSLGTVLPPFSLNAGPQSQTLTLVTASEEKALGVRFSEFPRHASTQGKGVFLPC
jgi:hypothetical protein